MFMIDLHIHSNYSDGTCSIEEIIKEAKSLGLKQIAITDHNTLDGSIVASKISDVEFVIGAELSVDYKDCEVHLLAYFPNGSDYKNVNFIIKAGEANKKIAILETIERLNAMGIDINVNELSEYTKGIINRVHICKALMKHGYVNSVNEGFEKYVGNHCPAFVDREKTSLFEAVDAIHKDGGLAIIAHPYEYDKLQPIYDFLNEVIEKVDGVECFHPSATSDQSKGLVAFVESHNKLVTGGSDFHGDNKPDICLDMMNVDEKYKIKRN